MSIPQHQSHTNKTYKSTISKDTTCKSSRKDSISKEQFEGVVKSKAFETKFPHQPQTYIKSIRKTMILFPQYKQNHLKNTIKQSILKTTNPIDQQVWKFTMAIFARFHFNYETITLGLSFYLKLTFKKYSIDQRPHYLKKFHISGCIYLAAKSIEIETKIPKPSDYQYFCGQNFTSQDYNKFQRFLILQLEYNLQKSTLFTFLNFYLSIGIFYQAQIFESDKEISELENQILQKGLQSLKKCLFLENECGNPEYEAIRIIRETRKKYNLTEECKIFRSFCNKNINYQAQRKKLSCYSFSNSMGSLLHSTRDSTFFTQRQITQASKSFQRQHQKSVFVSENKQSFKNNLGTISGSCILRRKPNTHKNTMKKEVFEGDSNPKVEGFKYVTLRDRSGLNCEEDMLRKQLIKCKSATFVGSLLINGAIKYQRNNFKQNSQTTTFQSNTQNIITIDSINPKTQIKTISSLLKSSKSVQYLNNVSIQCVNHARKLSKLEEQNEERIIEKSRSRFKSQQNSKLKEQQNLKNQNRLKYFYRKNKRNNNQLHKGFNQTYAKC